MGFPESPARFSIRTIAIVLRVTRAIERKSRITPREATSECNRSDPAAEGLMAAMSTSAAMSATAYVRPAARESGISGDNRSGSSPAAMAPMVMMAALPSTLSVVEAEIDVVIVGVGIGVFGGITAHLRTVIGRA